MTPIGGSGRKVVGKQATSELEGSELGTAWVNSSQAAVQGIGTSFKIRFRWKRDDDRWRAFHVLQDAMKGNIREPRSLILPVELRIRESIGPAPHR